MARIGRSPLARLALAAALFTSAPAPAPCPAQEGPPPDGPRVLEVKPRAKSKPVPRKPRRDPPGTYMGRPIAPVMTFEGAEWLVRPSREEEEQPDRMIDALKIPRGATVADIGAGVGYTSLRLAKRVGPKGKVLATDLQPEMLRMMADNIRAAGVSNVKPIRATPADTKLPEGQLDLALMVDVYHECPDPEAVLRGIHRALKPGGRLVLVEFRGEDPEVPIKPEHKMTLKQVRREVEPQGYTFKQSLEFLPWQHIIIFERPDDEPAKKAPAPEPAKKKADAAPG